VEIPVDSASKCTENATLTKKVHVNKVLQVSRLLSGLHHNLAHGEVATMPSVFVVPVYVEVPAGYERAIGALETILRRSGYMFYTGKPLPKTLEQCKKANNGRIRTERSPGPGGEKYLPELWDDNTSG
jgi:hypothetical protein